MDKRRALAALLALSLGSCSRHEHLAPINYSPPTTGPDTEIRTAIVQQSITSYQGPCPCPYSAPTCEGHSAYDKPTNQLVYCYTKDVPADMVSSYRATHASSASNDQPHQEPFPINPPHSEGSIVSPSHHAGVKRKAQGNVLEARGQIEKYESLPRVTSKKSTSRRMPRSSSFMRRPRIAP